MMFPSLKRAALAGFAGICLAAGGAARAFPDPQAELAAFPFGKQIIRVSSTGIKPVALWPGRARAHDSFSYEGGFVAWERESQTLYRWTDGSLKPLGRIADNTVYLSRDWALGESEAFARGSGFTFSLYRLSFGIRKTAAFALDCFVSDVLFLNGRCYIAGADRADTRNSLYEVDTDSGKCRLLASLPKSRDFGRIVSDGTVLWFFLSPSIPHSMPPAILSFPLGAGGAGKGRRILAAGLDAKELSWYGFGFCWDGLFWLPAAGGSGPATQVTLYAFEPGGSGTVLSAAPLPTGVTKPICAAGLDFAALGFLSLKNAGAYSILRFVPGSRKGEIRIEETALPLRP